MIDWKNAEFVTAPRSETPETDEEVRGPLGPHDYVHASFARSLECRLHEAENERDKWIGLHAQWVIQLVRAGHPSFGRLEDAIAALIAERDAAQQKP